MSDEALEWIGAAAVALALTFAAALAAIALGLLLDAAVLP